MKFNKDPVWIPHYRLNEVELDVVDKMKQKKAAEDPFKDFNERIQKIKEGKDVEVTRKVVESEENELDPYAL